MKIVKMSKRYGNNVPGDVCGFPNKIAEGLIEQGAAEFVKDVKDPVPGTALAELNRQNAEFDAFMAERIHGGKPGKETRT